ncbi:MULTISPECIES: 4-(cytidine 5'-diphospho)-2-C-methyl-D-erythritol kinase [unclassified Paracoccus (in: a-proteobacteria)]|uniref:4-(cytidine 5'-diphospho)-2-C-methyl-D-erythritol kinase n=1 Tax=unclassified Paracoccus (in: a-proteobacteria) TaxID=2688777 RepID=UPI0021E12B2C|nr:MULTISPECIES: 4-(cytidine 5'-diphospho)-2-C-methyl-D-erythritol kinase [unclassified Paracoccus (in: a-proteobacteria)]UXU75470.1 4-(cytidine 5'-diphospho)-2-C-methyl-D-erythritol kinase [Paracoccus sp. SMMA_5]UXU81375.1 4-(cytidine 5'-diphospho)-2-C-methyl-D-erythritol kinase [Paracoccus sp. SMMA_5_TC]
MSLPRREPAPAKVNLTLHVTGRRPDGYHLLDSLVVFLALGDVVTVSPGPLSLTLGGPFAGPLAAEADNLCLRAARLAGREVRIHLEKHLPVASGIGGGSADAAAVLRALDVRPAQPERLGADVPACLLSRPCRMRGLGDIVEPLPPLPPLHLVLVNPGQALATPAVFGALRRADNPPMPERLPAFPDSAALIDFVAGCRNDLEPPALALMPQIGDCLAALRDHGAALARMSGSGATCFGLFLDAAAARDARDALRAARPGWWVAASGLAAPNP